MYYEKEIYESFYHLYFALLGVCKLLLCTIRLFFEATEEGG
ncbi:hypothetical protein HMPREF9446_03382 [Bacteroides fluxus YIT 12057]|uniref:Uncharacterized protein n=1 Tax=Bacteroides fluxus YIT 12057 TaxID=763034 RepID=F3PX92_9BACE|nr:hypothetical protein HMPREF9446_03382 [Bacteroides fluxus YIT 12057]